MEITVQNSAKDLIRQKGGAFYIDSGTAASMCCGRINLGPSVTLGIPPNKEKFELEEVDGIHMYVDKEFVSPFPLIVVVSRFLCFRHLAIEGWKLI